MMIIFIEPNSEMPIYIQLMNQILVGIAKGELKPGDALPSVRALAADLGVNMHTVHKSYLELEKKGIIQIIPKSGAVIKESPSKEPETYERIYRQMKPLIAEAFVLGMTKEELDQLIEQIIREFKR